MSEAAAPAEAAELWLAVQTSADLQQLQQLAQRAQHFTPRVSVVPPDGLLLEIKGSLHLFNGIAGLLQAVAEDCAARHQAHSCAVAPTPLAALVAARAGQTLIITSPAQLIGQLAPLPLTTLRWPAEVLERLARMGVRTIGEVLRLPRAGLVRRFGVLQLAELDRLTGRSPDLRPVFKPRERFRRRRELTFEAESNTVLLGVLQPLLAELQQFLRVRQCALTAIECVLRHRHAGPTRCALRLAAPTADIAHLTGLLGERLSQLTLPEPVRSCELRSGELVPQSLASGELWQPGEHGGGAGTESPHLLERLQARLGTDALCTLQLLADHRPEKSWQCGQATRMTTHAPRAWRPGQRPFWLLMEPELLEERSGWPQRGGPLQVSADVERIESGWWDGRDAGRDYYRAQDVHGVRLWIFRERTQPHRWFLHGLFG
ncbi:MAG: DNA polymerase Y family protein [Sinobacteraceae bacterium]|nr:DNA polymerase Y family protein [Nevskiaceae bacterium]